MSSAFDRSCREIELTLPLTMGRIGTICRKGHSNDNRSTRATPATRGEGENMTADTNPDREDVLNEIARKWTKFSKRDLTNMTTNDQLIGEIVKKYNIKKEAAQ